MNKSDQLGSGSAFGAATTARSSRRNVIDTAINGADPGLAAPTELPVTLISDNPDNPRNHLRALDETVETVRELGVILPIVVATTDAYLRDRPDRADDLDDGATHIVVDGHRRLEAARRVGLATIPVRVDNARVATDETLLEAAFVANYHRDDMTDLEEAHALKSLVDYYGSQTKASRRLGIPQNTISSKLSLLKLAPELQKDLVTGTRQVEHVRNLGKLSPEEQKAKADERAQAARRKRETTSQNQPQPENGSELKMEPGSGPADYHGVITPKSSPAPATSQPERTEPGKEPPVPPQSSTKDVPETRPAPGADPIPAGRPIPYDDGLTVGRHLVVKMQPDAFMNAAWVMVSQSWDKAGPDLSFRLLSTMLDTANTRDADRLRPLLQEFLAQLPAESAQR